MNYLIIQKQKMPKSKEFIESSDSDNDGKSGGGAAAASSKPSKAKHSNSKNDVTSFKTNNLFFFLLCISLQLNDQKLMIQRMVLHHRRLDPMVNGFTM